MASATDNISRTTHLLALMKAGDDAFNDRDFAAMDAVHHPDMIAQVAGSAEPIHGRAAHAATMKEMFRIFPDVHVSNDPYPIQFGRGDWITVITRITGTFTGEMILPDAPRSPRQKRRSTLTSPRPPSGAATCSSKSSSSGTPLCRRCRSASPRLDGSSPLHLDQRETSP